MSDKPPIFEDLFNSRYNFATKSLMNPVVDSSTLKAAINHSNSTLGTKLSTDNPANFVKDYLRSPNKNALWPASMTAAKISVRQKYRKKRVFAFVDFEAGQTVPFPEYFQIPSSDPIFIEAVSLPSDARALGREDESWLIQVCVHQRILQTHFALHSHVEVVDIFHLHNSLKATPEIDAIFLITFKNSGKTHKALITLEAKRDEGILIDQIRSQVAYMSEQCDKKAGLNDIEFIFPVAVQSSSVAGKRTITVFEMGRIDKAEGKRRYDSEEEHLIKLKIESSANYQFKPQIVGI